MTQRRPVLLTAFILALLAACARGSADEATSELAATPAPTVPKPGAQEPVPGGDDDDDTTPATDDASTDAAVDAKDAGVVDASSPIEASVDSGPVVVVVTPPVVDGTIGAGEYGSHVDGQNQQVSIVGNPASTTWFMTWTATDLYVGVSAANVAEGVVLYVDTSPLSPANGGTDADGTLLGYAYDVARPMLPIRADFAMYVKASYNEYRRADGANGWSAPVANALAVQTSGATREMKIPWSAVRAAGRPSSFSWLGYAVSAGGYVYGELPAANAGGSIGQSTTYSSFFSVPDATPGSGSKPFGLSL